MPERDPDLEHQIVICYDRDNRNQIRVSCNCMAIWRADGGGRPRYKYMEEVPNNIEDSIRIYNDPDNHDLPETFRTALSSRTQKRQEVRTASGYRPLLSILGGKSKKP